MNIYHIIDKPSGQRLMRLMSDGVKRARWAFYATKGFGHHEGEVVVRLHKKGTERPDDAVAVTHKGKRLMVRGCCEKCHTPSNWVVTVMGRSAYWCGCE